MTDAPEEELNRLYQARAKLARRIAQLEAVVAQRARDRRAAQKAAAAAEAEAEAARRAREREQARDDTLHTLKLIISEVFDVPVGFLEDRSKTGKFPEARAVFYMVLRTEFGWSFPAIGRAVGRDHTTVLAAIRRAEANENTAAAANFVRNELRAVLKGAA